MIPFEKISLFRISATMKVIAAIIFAWTCVPALAQNAEVCTRMETKLKGLGDSLEEFTKAKEEYTKKYPDPAKAAVRPPVNTQFALDALTKRPSPFRIETSSDNLPSGGQAWFTITDKTYSNERADLCIHLYSRPITQQVLNSEGTKTPLKSDFNQVSINQTFRFIDASDNNIPKYKIIFDVPKPASGTLSADLEFLMVGMAGEDIFSYTSEEIVTHKYPGVIVALLFVIVIYLLLAWATYNPKDMDGLTRLRWFLYLFSPIRITAGVFGDSSISQVQLVLFTFIVAGLLMYLWMRTGLLASISKDLLYLLGISAVGAGGAKFTATIKSDLSPETKDFIIAKGWYNWLPIPAAVNANLANLLLTSGRLDVYKFQVAMFTIVVAAYVLSSGQNDLGDVEISDTMLYLIGISQGVYVGGKVITDRTTRIEDAVKKLKQLEPAAGAAKTAEYEAAEKTAKDEFAGLYQLKQP
jgi:hypothetical protein